LPPQPQLSELGMNSGRYAVPDDEDYKPDSNNSVLWNFPGIKNCEIMGQIEAQELIRSGLELVELYDENYQFLAEDICNIHELWLADIYPFAGKYRTVMMSKDGFPFANPEFIPKLMTDLELKYLKNLLHVECLMIRIWPRLWVLFIWN
jgi:cell filamentation protein